MTSQQENGDQIYDETIILTRVKEYFDLYKTLSYDMLDDFLDCIGLAGLLKLEEDKENLWNGFTQNSGDIKEIDYQACQKVMIEFSKSDEEASSEENNFIVIKEEVNEGLRKSTNQNLRSSIKSTLLRISAKKQEKNMNPPEMIKELKSKEAKSFDEVADLEHTLTTIENLYNNYIVDNYEKILIEKFPFMETKDKALHSIKDGKSRISSELGKIKRLLKKIMLMSNEKQDMLDDLKSKIEMIENNLKKAEEREIYYEEIIKGKDDYIYEENQKLWVDNKYYEEIIASTEVKMENSKKLSAEKDNIINTLIDEIQTLNKEKVKLESDLKSLKDEYNKKKEQFESRDDIIKGFYEQIMKEEAERAERERSINGNPSNNSQKNLLEVNQKKIISDLQKELEGKNLINTELKNELEEKKEVEKELRKLKLENVNLQSKIEVLELDVEMTRKFRERNFLRLSRSTFYRNTNTSKPDQTNEPKNNPSESFTQIQKNRESSRNSLIKAEDHSGGLRISTMKYEIEIFPCRGIMKNKLIPNEEPEPSNNINIRANINPSSQPDFNINPSYANSDSQASQASQASQPTQASKNCQASQKENSSNLNLLTNNPAGFSNLEISPLNQHNFLSEEKPRNVINSTDHKDPSTVNKIKLKNSNYSNNAPKNENTVIKDIPLPATEDRPFKKDTVNPQVSSEINHKLKFVRHSPFKIDSDFQKRELLKKVKLNWDKIAVNLQDYMKMMKNKDPNFEGANKPIKTIKPIKLGYLSKFSAKKNLPSKFKEKLVMFTDAGLFYFEDPFKQPKKLIPILESEISRVFEKNYKYCFEIKTSNGKSYVFAADSHDDLDSWIEEFENFKKNYEN